MKINKRVLRDRRSGDRRIKFKYMGSVDDITRECWSRSPALGLMFHPLYHPSCFLPNGKLKPSCLKPYYQDDWRVYGDELPIDPDYCLKRAKSLSAAYSFYTALSYAWIQLGLDHLDKKLNSISV